MSEQAISPEERTYLRELARKQAGYAASPANQCRRQMWYDLNDNKPDAVPPVVIETWTFNGDFMPASIFRCTSPAARGIEYQLLQAIRWFEILDDDHVIPDRWFIGWNVQIDHFGVAIPMHTAKDAKGLEIAYGWDHPIKDLSRDLDLLKPPTMKVDREATFRHKAFMEELLGDILPVQINSGWLYAHQALTQRVVHLMGMEAFFLAMYDAPDAVHRLMNYLAENALTCMRWAEAEGLLVPNNTYETCCGSSYNFTRQLPAEGYTGGPARLGDMWFNSDSQETVGIAADMFHEFCAPYYRKVAEPGGFLYFGCCEPAHTFWEDLGQLPHLKKISVNKWTDERFMGEALRGRNIVYSRKPDPNLLGVDVKLDEDAWRANIRKTLEATRGVPVEFLVRDVYTVHGNLTKPRRAVKLAREEIAQARG